LGTLGEEAAPFSQGALGAFRARLLGQDLARQLGARTVECAKAPGKCGWQQRRAALDSSPLLGAGRVEDTWHLLGRAMQQLVVLASQVTGLAPEGILHKAGVTVLGQARVKAALDGDGDAPQARQAG
jgi:hypothetical protein